MKEKIRIPQKNKKTFQNQALRQKSHQMNKHLGSPPCKMLETILKINKGEILTNERKDKEINDYARGLTPK